MQAKPFPIQSRGEAKELFTRLINSYSMLASIICLLSQVLGGFLNRLAVRRVSPGWKPHTLRES